MDQEQDGLSNSLAAELDSEQRWEVAFSKSLDALDRLAEEALAGHRAGLTQEFDPETL
jgi:hypothetical protein